MILRSKLVGLGLFGIGSLLTLQCLAQSGDFNPFPHVVDKDGLDVGHYLGGDGILFPTNTGKLVQGVFFAQTGFIPPPDYTPTPRSFYFLSNDCSGQKYLDAYTPVPTVVVLIDSGNFLYPHNEAVVTTFKSQRSVYDRRGPCVSGTVSVFAAPAKIEPIRSNRPPFLITLR